MVQFWWLSENQLGQIQILEKLEICVEKRKNATAKKKNYGENYQKILLTMHYKKYRSKIKLKNKEK
jgi:hypothetical protein